MNLAITPFICVCILNFFTIFIQATCSRLKNLKYFLCSADNLFNLFQKNVIQIHARARSFLLFIAYTLSEMLIIVTLFGLRTYNEEQ